MARSSLRLTDDEFWDMAPKCLFAMIDEYEELQKYNAILCAMANNGQELPGRKKKEKAQEPGPLVNPFFF